ncbi:MAG: PLDc N-terminal domain-containing protein [Syntrophaceae bacterium]|nr:PLDc N-terminal domain-containing protein [Syntrophaceae bacterium]
MFKGILGLVILILDIWAILQVFKSNATTGAKILWTVVIIVLPILGLIIWYFMGPKE